MDRTADLDAALSFVVERIAKQARLSGEALTSEQRFLLDNLPSGSASTRSLVPVGHPEIVELVTRNINYERVCAVAKAAYRADRETNPESLDWEFAYAVFTLNGHPMWGVLNLAGVKMYRRPLWDQLFILIAALCPLIAVIFLATGPQTVLRWAGILCPTVAVMLLMYFASQQIGQRQLENHIERCRLASRNISWKSS